jgi:hypothetical protein
MRQLKLIKGCKCQIEESQTIHCKICGGQVALGQVFLPVLWFGLVSIIHFTLTLLFSDGQVGKVLGAFKLKCSFENWGALDRKVLSCYFIDNTFSYRVLSGRTKASNELGRVWKEAIQYPSILPSEWRKMAGKLGHKASI